MKFSHKKISQIASTSGFRPDVLEKVIHLLNLLNALNSHPYLKNKFALKGGTALNLFVFKLPRMSVDIDLNYVGAVTREDMLRERPKIEEAFHAVFSREGFNVKRMPEDHAGGKWRLTYSSFTGQSGNLEVDLNFMLRQPLWDVKFMDSHPLNEYQAKGIPVLNVHELTAGKLHALFTRHQGRDLFDAHQLFHHFKFDKKSLRTAFLAYGACSRRDWRTIKIDNINFEIKELKRMLIPVLSADALGKGQDSSHFAKKLVAECRDHISTLLPFSKDEVEFLDGVMDRGIIQADLITSDEDLKARIMTHPMLLWKIQNVCKHYGIG